MNRTRFRRAAALLLALLFSLSLFSCSKEPAPQRFDAFLDSLPARFLDGADYSLNFLFLRPEDYGIEMLPFELSFSTQEDYREGAKEIESLLKELGKFPFDELTESQQLTYRVIEDSLTRSLRLYDYYYLDNTSLGISLGMQSDLPFMLADFSINRQEDLDGYFSLIRSVDAAFQQYAAFEQERIDNGYGLCQEMIDGIIDQCHNTVEEGGRFIIDGVNARLQSVDFLSESEKQEAMAENEKLITTVLLPAYQNLAQAMENITGAGEPQGLVYFEDGRAYYEALVQASVGTDMTIPGIRALLVNEIENTYLALQAIVAMNPDLDLEEEADYGSFSTTEETIDYLAQVTAADFPALPQLNYTVKAVPKALQDNFAPAAYLNVPIDTPLTEPQTIYLNGDFDPALFPTIAHEGYPGHLYQNTYYKSLQAPAIRYLIDYGGYTEGWATYVEWMSPQFAQNPSTANELDSLFSRLSLLYSALFDIGVHHDGWTLEQFHEQICDVFGDMELEDTLDTYLYILESPGNYLRYCVGGLLFQQLHDQAAEALGDSFVAADFHKVLLDAGPASFPILGDLVEEYITSARR